MQSVNPEDKEVKKAGARLATNKVIRNEAVMAAPSQPNVIHI